MRYVLLMVLFAIGACSNGSGASPAAVAANAFSNDFLAGVRVFFGGLPRFGESLPALLDPEEAAARGITFELDESAPDANTYDYSIPLDGDGDGTNDTLITGRVILNQDPTGGLPGLGFGGTLMVDVNINDGQTRAVGNFTFEFTAAGLQIYGEASVTTPGIDTVTTITIAESDPIVVNSVSEADGRVDNACGLNADGPAAVMVERPTGVYEGIFTWLSGRTPVTVSGASYMEPGGEPTPVSDSSVTVGDCATAGSIEDWVGTWILSWNCIPLESGTSRLTITMTGPTTLRIVDDGVGEDEGRPPIVFTATVDPATPNIARGTFQEDEGGGEIYEEQFVATLAPGGASWTQNNTYEYIAGPATGSGGICGGTATRQ